MIPSGDVEQFRTLIADHLGLVFDDNKLGMLEDVLRRRCSALDIMPVGYLAQLADAPRRELGALAAELTVGETYFFRNNDQFVALAQAVLPDRLREGHPVRVLSAGCASGEEPYSVAVIAREIGIDPRAVAIRAVDVNPEALQRAERARYSAWALRETSASIQERWFRSEGREHVLDDAVRRAVRFDQRNLVEDDSELWAPESYDVVFCRNVIMYFAPATMRHVVARIERALRPGGYLFLGHAETLRGLSGQFHLCHTHGTFYYRRHGADVRASTPLVVTPPNAGSLTTIVDGADSWVEAIHRASERIRSLTSQVEPEPPPARSWDLGAALELLRDERFADALTLLERLPPESERDPDVLLLYAVLLAHAGRFAAADDACRALLRIDELNAGAHYVLALCREAGGESTAACEHDEVALYLDPTFAMARLHLGLLARRAGDRQTAKHQLAQASVLLEREDASRLLLFGGGFQREALISLCRSGIEGAEGSR